MRTRTLEAYAKHYTMAWPFEEHRSARPLRVSPLYQRLKEQGACFGEKLGWERPNWFAPNEKDPRSAPVPELKGWALDNWSPAIAAEVRATREAAALFDETSFAKIEVQGPGARDFLQSLCANDIDKPVGTVVYTQMLNARGGIECDFTVTCLAPDRFLIVTGTMFGTHDMTHLRRYMPLDGTVYINDLTSARTCYGLWGPRARDILQGVTRADVSNAAFPYMTARQITIGNVPVLALRVTYVGELGWEFYDPSEYGEQLWDTLWQAGKPFGMLAAGYNAIDSLRLEKGYRYWSADITPDYTPFEGGLGFAVSLNKEENFMGRESLKKQKAEGITRKL